MRGGDKHHVIRDGHSSGPAVQRLRLTLGHTEQEAMVPNHSTGA